MFRVHSPRSLHVELLRDSAQQNHPPSQWFVGMMYEHGYDVTPDSATALMWYKRAADNGLTIAKCDLEQLPARRVQHLDLIRDRASQDDAVAQWALGVLYEHGYDVTRDLPKALAFYKRAARSDLDIAQVDLAGLIWLGLDRSRVSKCIEFVHPHTGYVFALRKGAGLCRKAADQGLPMAQYSLADVIRIVKLDGWEKKYLMWMERAAQGGCAEAAFKLGQWFNSKTYGQTPDLICARTWYQRAQDLGSADGTFYLAMYNEHGKGGAKNEAKAGELYRKAAEGGSAAAYVALAHYYRNGQLGFPKDMNKANECRAKHDELMRASDETRKRQMEWLKDLRQQTRTKVTSSRPLTPKTPS